MFHTSAALLLLGAATALLGAATAQLHGGSVSELDAASFHSLLTVDEDRDALVLFYDGADCTSACHAALDAMDAAAAQIGPSIAVAIYDVAAQGGMPAGVHT